MKAWEYRAVPFWERAEHFIVRVPEGGCHFYMGSLDGHGYAQPKDRGRGILLHRAVWELHCGPIPAGKQVCHRCDNPSCVNPHHLFLGSASENMQDKVRKGRANMRRGEAHPKAMAKITRQLADAIRARLRSGERGCDLATEFSVTRQLVSDINVGKTWV